MKKFILPILAVTLFTFSACTQPNSTNELTALSARVDMLSTSVAALEKQNAAIEDPSSQAQTDAITPDQQNNDVHTKKVDYLKYSQIADVLTLLPAEYNHPFAIETLSRVIIEKGTDSIQIILIYSDQAMNNQIAEQMASGLGTEPTYLEESFSGSPAWEMETSNAAYHIQMIEPEHWYGELVPDDGTATAVYMQINGMSGGDIATWFDDNTFSYEDYLLPDILKSSLAPARKSIAIPIQVSPDDDYLFSMSEWENLTTQDIMDIYHHYVQILGDNEWFFAEGDPAQFSSIYTILDKDRTILIKTAANDENEAFSCRIVIAYSEPIENKE